LNEYRVSNGVTELDWSDDLFTVSNTHTIAVASSDSVHHSNHNSYECVAMGRNLAGTVTNKDGFDKFLKEHFDMEYTNNIESISEDSVKMYLNMYVIYQWDKSPSHKAIILKDDLTIGSVDIIIKDMELVSNKKVIGGKIIEFANVLSHYKVDFYAVINLN
jgi:uncharacterized protein YkwD